MTFNLNDEDTDIDLPDPPHCPLCNGKLVIVPSWLSARGVVMVTACSFCHWIFERVKP